MIDSIVIDSISDDIQQDVIETMNNDLSALEMNEAIPIAAADERTVTPKSSLLDHDTMLLFNTLPGRGTDRHTFRSYIPTLCPKYDTVPCVVLRHGFVYRMVYDVNDIKCVRIPRYCCSQHQSIFDAVHDCMTAQLTANHQFNCMDLVRC